MNGIGLPEVTDQPLYGRRPGRIHEKGRCKTGQFGVQRRGGYCRPAM
jgi:hypothetical protein